MTEPLVLTPEEQRILGSLLEKQSTVPASYPMTANALRAACNQTSNRDPVVEYDEQLVAHTARSLKERGLVRIVWSDTGRRTLKYHQVLDERVELDADERAVLTVLLLRAPRRPESCGPGPSGCMPSPTGARSRRACAGSPRDRSRWSASSSGGPASRTGAGSTSWDRSPRRRQRLVR